MLAPVLQAFWSGLLSAASMPLGTITSRFWRPSGRLVGSLTAFGAGALLSATVLNLVADAVEAGHIIELVIGSMLGSLFFTTVNRFVNQFGGFLRKPATAMAHVQQQQEQQFQQFLSHVKRMDVFRSLPTDDLHFLTGHALLSHYPAGTVIYPPKSTCESLYILQSGDVQLLDPLQDMQPFTTLQPGDSFSRMAFFAGTPHGTSAVATTDCEVAIVPKDIFEDLLETSPELNTATQWMVQSEEVARYLQERHYFTPAAIQSWVGQAVAEIQANARIPDAIAIENEAAEFRAIARQLQRLPLFQYLPNEDIEAISNRLTYRQYDQGETLFYQGETADRLYILHTGGIALSDPKNPSRKVKLLESRDIFGGFSLITGAPHSVTAVAGVLSGVWELPASAFKELLKQSPELREAVETLFRQKIEGYLQEKQGFSPEQSSQWLQQASTNLHTGVGLPSVQDMMTALAEHGNAPLAIWLGLLIDGIPESLIIGASVVAGGGVSGTLLAGLFISNYPEALSSSDGMRQQGFPFSRILLLWCSVMLVQGIVAGLGSLLLADAPMPLTALIEAFGAGAILTVLTETMFPEAYERRGFMVGLSMLCGFLVIILMQTLG
ncbi:MAG: cyclic nucleotide-binding domain-containing protein [Leptolyngbya sp. SIOISBB]|nr:cyclic nucleotide-binding domain-containing protein [Leptolyngbya sp. SIOISBB]